MDQKEEEEKKDKQKLFQRPNDETWVFQTSKVQSSIDSFEQLLTCCSLDIKQRNANGNSKKKNKENHILQTHMPSNEYCINISIRYTYVVVYKKRKIVHLCSVFKLQTPTCLWLGWWL